MDGLFLSGRKAVVTGGTRGIGYAIARGLVGAGASVAITGRSEESVKKAVDTLATQVNGGAQRVVGLHADAAVLEDHIRFYKFTDDMLGDVDVVVNNAGVGVFKKTSELSVEDWRRTIDTNLSGVFYSVQEALKRFARRGGGYLIQIGSLAGKNAFAGGAAYNASKFGLNGFSEALMLDHRYDKVRVTTIMPGSVNTEFGGAGSAEWKIAPEDIAQIVLDLLRMPERTLISRVEVRPSLPPRKPA